MLDKSKEQRAAEEFLETSLPNDARDVRFLYYKPGDDQDIYSAYLKFECAAGSYTAFAQQLDLKTNAEQLTPHLPAAWGLPRQLSLEWWDPEQATPDNATAKSISNGGWIVAKYEHQHVYLIVEGSGARSLRTL